jgi:alanine racemase
MATVLKANAYGYGDIILGFLCEKLKIDLICLNSLFEAERMRKCGVKTDIFIMGFIPFKYLKKV